MKLNINPLPVLALYANVKCKSRNSGSSHNRCNNFFLQTLKEGPITDMEFHLIYSDKNVLKRRRECGTYLATARRHSS